MKQKSYWSIDRQLARLAIRIVPMLAVFTPLALIFEPHKVTSLRTHMSIWIVSFVVGTYVSNRLIDRFPNLWRKA